jgi:hypothetical protein
MTAANRATRIGKLHTLLKKAYKPIDHSPNRPLIEHLIYACLLENAPYELADEALARLEQDYFDWNEVRVTTVTELAEVLSRLPDPTAAALRLKKNLHSIFESMYSFDLEELRKQNLGKAQQRFEKLPAVTPFLLSYLTQHGLGGHAIPLDSAALRFFWLADIINENELKTGRVTGLERAVPKNKGSEFASLLHQAAVAINIDPNDSVSRNIVLALNPDLEQKLADHVAAVKKRRVEKAQAKADAEQAQLDLATEKPASKPAKNSDTVTAKPSAKDSGKGPTAAPAKTKNPAAAKASEAKASEAKASEAKASEAKPSDAKAVEAKANETKAAEVKASEPKGADTKSAASKSTESKTSGSKGAESKPVPAKPTASKPAAPKTSGGKDTSGKTAEGGKEPTKTSGTKSGAKPPVTKGATIKPGPLKGAIKKATTASNPPAAEKKKAAAPPPKKSADKPITKKPVAGSDTSSKGENDKKNTKRKPR